MVGLAINDVNQVVGYTGLPWDSKSAMLWENGDSLLLDELIPAYSGWHLEIASDINNRGSIVGYGWHDGQIRGFLLQPCEQATILQGKVVFEDGITSIRSTNCPEARVYLRRRGMSDGIYTLVNDNGWYSVEASFVPGEYDIVLRYTLPAAFRHQDYAEYVFQPSDLNPDPDVVVANDGTLSRCRVDIICPWPAILLHGIINPIRGDDNGPNDFTALQSVLSNKKLEESGNELRKGVICLVPDLGVGDFESYYTELRAQLPSLLQLFPASTRFRLLGYSQGGLVARLLLQNGTDLLGSSRIDRVFLVATPNKGTCLAAGTSYDWLSETSIDSFNDTTVDGRGRPFYLLAGEKPITHPCLPRHHDRVVPRRSVFSLETMAGYIVADRSIVSASHWNITKNSETLSWAYQRLTGD